MATDAVSGPWKRTISLTLSIGAIVANSTASVPVNVCQSNLPANLPEFRVLLRGRNSDRSVLRFRIASHEVAAFSVGKRNYQADRIFPHACIRIGLSAHAAFLASPYSSGCTRGSISSQYTASNVAAS